MRGSMYYHRKYLLFFQVGLVLFLVACSSAGNAQKKIAFTSIRDGNQEIYVMAVDGSRPTRLTDNPADDFGPAWSPDGKQIAFSSKRDGPQRQIYVMKADGSGQTRLTTDNGDDSSPAWSPDGKQIAYQQRGNGKTYQIQLLNVAEALGGKANPRSLTSGPGNDGVPSWSSDGKHILFQSDRDGNLEIYVMNV